MSVENQECLTATVSLVTNLWPWNVPRWTRPLASPPFRSALRTTSFDVAIRLLRHLCKRWVKWCRLSIVVKAIEGVVVAFSVVGEIENVLVLPRQDGTTSHRLIQQLPACLNVRGEPSLGLFYFETTAGCSCL